MKILLLLILSLLFVGCSHTPEKVYIDNYVFIPVVCEDFGRIDPVRSLPVVFVEADTSDGFKVLGLRGDMYSNLAIIIRDTLRYIGEQDKAIDYYTKCIENHNSTTLNEEGEPIA
jgi:hypothetical protein